MLLTLGLRQSSIVVSGEKGLQQTSLSSCLMTNATVVDVLYTYVASGF